jgi:hypothetical protein
LRHAHALGGARHVTALGDGDEDPELLEPHGGIIDFFDYLHKTNLLDR